MTWHPLVVGGGAAIEPRAQARATPAAAHTFPFLNDPSFLVLKRGHRLAQKLAIVGLDSQTLPKSSLVGAFTLGKGSVTVPVFSPCASSVPKPSYPSKDTKTPG